MENISGVKASTLRMWEWRYSILRPHRTSTNIRYYDDRQLKKLLNIVILLRHDMRISEIKELSEQEIKKKIKTLFNKEEVSSEQYTLYINQLIERGVAYEERNFEKLLHHAFLHFGIEDTFLNIIYPVMRKTGVLWGTSELEPAQEHFIANIVRQKLLTAIDGLPYPSVNTGPFLLFLPETEHHEMGLLLSQYIIRKAGQPTIYLGAQVPFDNVVSATKKIQAAYALTFFVTTPPAQKVNDYINQFITDCPDTSLLIAGNKWLLNKIDARNNVHLLPKISSLHSFLS